MSDTTSSDPLFTPWTIGKLQLKHRIVMAPLTRNRATASTAAPNSLIAEYYEQRASDGGLLITEVSDLVNSCPVQANVKTGDLPVCRSWRLSHHSRTVHAGACRRVEKNDRPCSRERWSDIHPALGAWSCQWWRVGCESRFRRRSQGR
jgi:hypothetical protein